MAIERRWQVKQINKQKAKEQCYTINISIPNTVIDKNNNCDINYFILDQNTEAGKRASAKQQNKCIFNSIQE